MPKIGGNEPCPCGSGRKYKKCCMPRYDSEEQIGAMIPFAERYPSLAEHETRSAVIIDEFNRWELPVGSYGFIESYCADRKCDCRRVFINVAYIPEKFPCRTKNQTILATIGYGWEPLDFYARWLGSEAADEDLVQQIKGPILELGGVYSKYSEKLLQFFKKSMLQDEVFVKRLKSHYRLVCHGFNDEFSVSNDRFEKYWFSNIG